MKWHRERQRRNAQRWGSESGTPRGEEHIPGAWTHVKRAPLRTLKDMPPEVRQAIRERLEEETREHVAAALRRGNGTKRHPACEICGVNASPPGSKACWECIHEACKGGKHRPSPP